MHANSTKTYNCKFKVLLKFINKFIHIFINIHKVPGPDTIEFELFKYQGEMSLSLLHKICVTV